MIKEAFGALIRCAWVQMDLPGGLTDREVETQLHEAKDGGQALVDNSTVAGGVFLVAGGGHDAMSAPWAEPRRRETAWLRWLELKGLE